MSIIPIDVQNRIEEIREKCGSIKPLVVTYSLAYNHEQYIRDALEGFVMQKTDFPFVAIVHDDASTDGTADIIREYAETYPEIIKPIYETENQYSKRDGSLLKIINSAIEATDAKYIAMCEGDDYWTDPLKLQKQVDFLESHPDYGMCYTKVKRYNQSKSNFIDTWGGPYETLEQLLYRNTIPTLSVLFKHNLLKQYYYEIRPEKHDWLMGDYPLWLYMATISKIKVIPIVTGVYRILNHSASHPRNLSKKINFIINYREIALYFARRNNHNIVDIINHDIKFWEYANTISLRNRVSIKNKIKRIVKEKNFKRRLLIFLSILSTRAFKYILSSKL